MFSVPSDFYSPTTLAVSLLGLALVFAGRRLFWLFVGAVGFLAGLRFAPLVVPPHDHGMALLLGLGLGILGALLAVLFQRLAIAAAGWMAGGLIAIRLAFAGGWHHRPEVQIAFLIGAILTAILFSMLFDWALIALTSVVGAIMVVNGWETASPLALVIAAVLVTMGIAVQARSLEGASE
jgi:hypothetical protein